jgi:hypothetical protein
MNEEPESNAALAVRKIELEIEVSSLRSHEMHMRHIYGLRWGGLILAALTIVIGAAMIFAGLQGSFDWAVGSPSTLTAKLTNASPGIVFATVGMILGFVVVVQKPVNYRTGGPGGAIGIEIGAPKKRPRKRRFGEISIEAD